jgi:hypothetical protein
MSIILCTNNYNFNAKNDRKTSTCPITSACPITKPKVYITFLKGCDAGFLKNFKLSINLAFEKNFSVVLECMGGVAGIWDIHFFSSPYLDEIIIFGLSKNQTFRI